MACKFNTLVSLRIGRSNGMAKIVPNVAFPLARWAIPLVNVNTTLNPADPSSKPRVKTLKLYTGLPKNKLNIPQVAKLRINM